MLGQLLKPLTMINIIKKLKTIRKIGAETRGWGGKELSTPSLIFYEGYQRVSGPSNVVKIYIKISYQKVISYIDNNYIISAVIKR